MLTLIRKKVVVNMNKQVIVITGSSRGIGAATAIQAAKAGYAVCINYVSNEKAANHVLAAVEETGSSAIVVKGDMAIESDVEHLFEQVDKRLGTVTALVNNTGITTPMKAMVDTPLTDIKRLLDTNILSFFMCSRAAIQRMSTDHGGNGGNIVNVSSLAAKYGSANTYVHYAASKAAMDTFTVGLSKEVASQGIRVNAVRPGMIHTDIHAVTGDPDRVNKAASRIPLGRGGEADEIANGILFLLSNKASYITGALLDIGGGL